MRADRRLLSTVLRTAAGVIAAMAAILFLPSPSRADTVISSEADWTPVNALEGRLVWSSYRPLTDDYVLKMRHNGVISQLPVAPRGVAFDADLGRDSQGHDVVAYSRCRTEPQRVMFGPPGWSTGRGCDVYLYDFATGAERTIASAATAAYSEFLPSVWGKRVVFVARVDDRDLRPPGWVRLGQLNSSEPAKELYSPPTASSKTPDLLDLRGGHIAINFSREEDGDPRVCIGEHSADSGDVYELWLYTVGGSHRRVGRGCTNAPNTWAVGQGVLARDRLSYIVVGRGGQELVRFDYKKKRSYAASIHRYAGSPVFDGGRYYYILTPQEGNPFQIFESDPLRFRPVPSKRKL